MFASFSGFCSLVNVASVADFVNQDHLLISERFVNDAVISFSIFEESGEVTFQRLRLDLIEMYREPLDLIDDSACYRRIQLFKLSTRVF